MTFEEDFYELIGKRCDDALNNSEEYKELDRELVKIKSLGEYQEVSAIQLGVVCKLCYILGWKDSIEENNVLTHKNDTH